MLRTHTRHAPYSAGHETIVKDLVKYPRTKAEARVISILKQITNHNFPTVNPSWLVWKGKTLELDGYNDHLKLALEFSGPLHTKWYPAKEPYEKYFSRIVKDVVKQRLCKKNHVDLLVIDMSLPERHWRNYILSRLYDFKRIQDRPTAYIDMQTYKPFRNKQLEKELKLSGDWFAAKKIK